MGRMRLFRYCPLLLVMLLHSGSGKENALTGMNFLKTVLSKIQNERAELAEEEPIAFETAASGLFERMDTDGEYLYFPPGPGNETLYVTPVKPIQAIATTPSSASPNPVFDSTEISEDFFSILFSPQNLPTADESNDSTKQNKESNESSNLSSSDDYKLNSEQPYQYYYYPITKLNEVPPELASAIKSAIPKKEKPIKPPVIKTKPTPMPNKNVKNKTKTPVTPLFRAMTMFISTAMIFIVTILLMPRVRLVKMRNFDQDSGYAIYPGLLPIDRQ